MKHFCKILFVLFIASLSVVQAQDISLSLTTEAPNPVAQGTSGTVKVTICNNGIIPLTANRVRPLISFPSTLTGASVTVISGAGWTVLSNDGQSIRLQNNSILSLLPATCSDIILGFTGVNIGGPLTVTGTLGFNGPQTIGNQTGNDNSTSTITVVAPCATLTAIATNPSTCLGSNGSIRLCGFVPNQGGYTISYSKSGVPATPLTNQTADVNGCITIANLTAGSYTNIRSTSIGCTGGSNVVSSTLSDPIPPAPTLASASPSTICQGASSILSATCATGTVTWYSDSALNLVLPSTTVSPNTTTTYYAACVVSTTNCKSPSSSTTVTVNPTPAAPTSASASPSTICQGESSILSAACATGTVTWYSDAALNAVLPSTTVSPTTTTTYYAACVSGAACKSPSLSTTVTVNPTPAAPTSASASPSTICQGASSILSASCATGTVTWYSDAALNVVLPSTTVSPNTTTTYYAACVVSTTNCKSLSSSTTVTVNPTPVAPTSASASPSTICQGESSMLSATCATGTVTWYSDAALNVVLPSTTVSPTTTTTYYAACVSGTACKSPSLSTTVTVNPTPAAPTSASASPSTICQGESSMLTASCATGTVTWYSDAALNAVLPSTTVSPTTTTTYYAACVSGAACRSSSSSITLTVNETPAAPTGLAASPPAINISVTTSHTLSGNCSTGTLTWFSNAALTQEVTSPVNPSTTTTYYASCISTQGCKSLSASLTISVIPDLTPTIEVDNLQFASEGSQRDFVVNIFEINEAEQITGTQISFRVAKISAFDITYSPISGTSDVFGGTANDNSNWTFTENTDFITVTSKPGNTMSTTGQKAIGFTVTRKTDVPPNTSQNITASIINGSAGEDFHSNNIVVTTITAN
jgi:hypothetical protein